MRPLEILMSVLQQGKKHAIFNSASCTGCSNTENTAFKKQHELILAKTQTYLWPTLVKKHNRLGNLSLNLPTARR